MDQLSIYLPPFAGDYSGVCSALFELNCLIIIDDASCCTRNYTNFDEPRWSQKKKTTFCSKLKTIEAVLGDEERLIKQTIEAAEAISPEFIALLGSPVPAIIGRDMSGIAREIETLSGIPTLGFDTTGFSYYNKGISAALLQLIKRFGNLESKPVDHCINILGMTPLDLSANENAKQIIETLEKSGFNIGCSFFMHTGMNQVYKAHEANVNLVVTQSGLAAAKYMYEQFEIPYVAAMPLGIEYSNIVVNALKQTELDKICKVSIYNPSPDRTPDTLIIGDQIISNSIRTVMYQMGYQGGINVASFFALEPELSDQGDLFLPSEKQLIDLLKKGSYKNLIADPVITQMPAASSLVSHVLPHPAVSSQLHWDQVPLFVGDSFDKTLQHWSR